MRLPFRSIALASMAIAMWLAPQGAATAASSAASYGVPTEPGSATAPQRSVRRSQPTQRPSDRRRSTANPRGRTASQPDPRSKTAPDSFEVEKWFKDCDSDGSGWISFFESRKSMDFGRKQFLSYDQDKDGRMTKPEFTAYCKMASKLRQFTPPRRQYKPTPPQRDSNQLLLAYDSDLNNGISLSETRRIIRDYSREELDVEGIFSRMDRDRSKLLDIGELTALTAAIQSLNEAPAAVNQVKSTKRIDEFFLQVDFSKTSSAPDRIIGPVTTFRRLDTDGNGRIVARDLSELQKRLRLTIRPQTILHTLDTNQDGALDRREFLRAMESQPD